MAYYPVMLDIKGRKCLVVGGGNVALRKVLSLLACKAEVTVISPSFNEGILKLADEGKIELIKRTYHSGDAEGYFITVVATDDNVVNRLAASDCEKYGIPVNVVDDKELSSFIVPSVIRRGDLTVSISTSGKSPLVSRMIREKLESVFTDDYDELLQKLYKKRLELKEKELSDEEKINIYKEIIKKSGLLKIDAD